MRIKGADKNIPRNFFLNFLLYLFIVCQNKNIGRWNRLFNPPVDVSFGVAAGAFSQEKKNNGAGGMGGKIMPSAVLVIQNGTTKLVNIKNQDGITKILDMVPDFVNKFTSKNDVVSEDSAADQTDDAAKSAAGKEMEDILKDSANK